MNQYHRLAAGPSPDPVCVLPSERTFPLWRVPLRGGRGLGGGEDAAVAVLLDAVHHRQQGVQRQQVRGEQPGHRESVLGQTIDRLID